ncbi:hypothetical protein HHK36_011641 [Tetracentron sinense]|uniref:Uncharacterized protein n=1 Tax=Tetracentron sinense TaxID=13715 RepID=A0A834ZIZ6_TETSI|nr:hypothetical protein HHK36_011641 [Tetracentron sinense]
MQIHWHHLFSGATEICRKEVKGETFVFLRTSLKVRTPNGDLVCLLVLVVLRNLCVSSYFTESQNTKWGFGAPPNYDVVNKLFEEGRTKIWPPGSIEEKVQNVVKTWEMEMFHKTCFGDYKTADLKKYRISLNDVRYRRAMGIEVKRSNTT